MGVSTDAMLVYGYIWEEETDLLGEENDDREWEEVLLIKRGMTSPWESHPGGSNPEWMEAHRAEIDAWHEARKAVAAEFGVDIDQHGSDGWSVPIIRIVDVGMTAARGYPQQVTAATLTVGPTWNAKLTTFCRALDIDLTEARGPGWFLASWWG